MTHHRRILVVDDARDTRELLQRRVEARGFTAALASSVDEAIAVLETSPFDLVITDLRMPGRSGMDLVRHLHERHPATGIVMVTGYATIPGAVDAMKSGAHEYLAKPFTSAELRDAVDRALARADEARRVSEAASPARERFGLVGASPGMRAAFAAMEEALASDRPVLLLGEAGTGRRAAARALLAAGAGGALLDLDALAPGGLEAPGPCGGALLRRAEALGDEALPALRRLAASLGKRGARLFVSAPLAPPAWEAVRAHHVLLPPLRERGGDILLLAARFATRVPGAPPRPLLAPEAARLCEAYAWPGNVAELEQVIAGALARSGGGTIGAAELPSWMRAEAPAERSLADVEAEHIARVLRHTRGNRSRAAEILGINRRTLGEKLKDPRDQKE